MNKKIKKVYMNYINIIKTGKYLPEQKIKNDELEKKSVDFV